MKPLEILEKYWGYKAFRPLQETIVNSIISGQDTLAILPTGGGKSICFQIPGLSLGGITLVISPLISLMNDQVENLKKRGISAIALHSGLTKNESEIEYSNFKNGKYKFVYVSPERIKTERFRDIISIANITLLAIDEAHCISQWGYDFRPDYLLISELRSFLKNVPVIALTASATPKVEQDIHTYLTLSGKAQTFRQTIVRSNLNYVVLNDENKHERLLKITRRLAGTGLVYTRNRKSTVLLSEYLNKNGMAADFYHAGLDYEERFKKQEAWQKGKTRIIVCTNAFGMGIDKSDVRFVVHFDLPESPEAYYQEAGRAGRDGSDSWCILLYCHPDLVQAERQVLAKFMEKKQVEQIYNALCNHLQIPYGGGFDETYEIDTHELAQKYKISLPEIYTAFGMMQNDGILKISEAFTNPSRLRIVADNTSLYQFYLKNPTFELFIKTILRMYGGIFDNYIQISEFDIARNIKLPIDKIKSGLERLTRLQLFDYIPQNNEPIVNFLIPRPVNIPYNKVRWNFLKEAALERLAAMEKYSTDKSCRQTILASYFGESKTEVCGKCDYCRDMNKQTGTTERDVKSFLKRSLAEKPMDYDSILKLLSGNSDKIEILRSIMDNGQIKKNKEGLFIWNE
jgi:ATP-dependent DNA helicase RecQ